MIELKPFENFLSKLLDDIRKAGIAAYTVYQLYKSPSKQDFKSVISGLKAEIIALQEDKVNLVGSYIALHTIHSMVQRSLIPIIGTGLNFLFGTITESDLKTICNNVDKLAKNQEVAQIIDEDISVINVTRVEMSENRPAINKIIGRVSLLDSKIGNITQALERDIFQVSQFIKLCLQLDSVIQAIRRTI